MEQLLPFVSISVYILHCTFELGNRELVNVFMEITFFFRDDHVRST